LLSTPKERVELLSKAGVSEPLFLPFDQTVAELPAQTFVAQILVKELEAIGVVVGTDFRFGTKRLGDTELLRSVLAETGAVLDVVTKVEEDNAAISSSRIRQSIGSGCFDEALALLGHGYPVSGQVVPGDQRGREIGFPTANLQIHRDKLLPQPGVYGGTTTLKNERLPVIVNVGTRPTFKAESVLGVEAHVIDAPPDLDLYGHTLTLHLDYHLRDERRFASVEALTKQITLDIEALQRQFR